MKNPTTALLILFLVAGCGQQTDSNNKTPGLEIDSALVMLRPDANNAVGQELEYPPGWRYRLDKPDPEMIVGSDTARADIWFVTMTPGWHVTTRRPSAILYHPSSTTEGTFTISSKIHLMYPGGMNEAYGLFFGGKNLEADDQSYMYFLIRRSGEFLVKRRIGPETETVHGWTAHEAIIPFDDDTEVIATNTLAISVTESTVSFLVNDVEVYATEKGDIQTDGITGLRFNHGINSHVETFDVVPAL